MNYITSEPGLPKDEYSAILDSVFSLTDDGSFEVFARIGVKNALSKLSTHVYPVPRLADFEWFLRNTRPIGISDGIDVLCVAENFMLDEFTRYDWIRADFSPTVVLSKESRDDFLGFVTRLTLYKLLRYNWDRYEHGKPE